MAWSQSPLTNPFIRPDAELLQADRFQPEMEKLGLGFARNGRNGQATDLDPSVALVL